MNSKAVFFFYLHFDKDLRDCRSFCYIHGAQRMDSSYVGAPLTEVKYFKKPLDDGL